MVDVRWMVNLVSQACMVLSCPADVHGWDRTDGRDRVQSVGLEMVETLAGECRPVNNINQ